MPGISENEKTEENSSPRGGKCKDLTPAPTFLMNTDTSQTCELTSQRPHGPDNDF